VREDGQLTVDPSDVGGKGESRAAKASLCEPPPHSDLQVTHPHGACHAHLSTSTRGRAPLGPVVAGAWAKPRAASVPCALLQPSEDAPELPDERIELLASEPTNPERSEDGIEDGHERLTGLQRPDDRAGDRREP
jgi:hypothetical protein